MAIKTLLAQIEEVQAAITKVMTSQSYTLGDASVQRAKLDALTKRESWLLAQYRKEQGTTPVASQAYFGDAGD